MLLRERYTRQRSIYHAKAEGGGGKARLHSVSHQRTTGCQEESSVLRHTPQPNPKSNSKNRGRGLSVNIWGEASGSEGSPGISALFFFLMNRSVPQLSLHTPTATYPAKQVPLK